MAGDGGVARDAARVGYCETDSVEVPQAAQKRADTESSAWHEAQIVTIGDGNAEIGATAELTN
jgi:hypothetical protein